MKSKKRKVFELLLIGRQNHKLVTNTELNQICFRYGDCIFMLRRAGLNIDTVRVRNEPWEKIADSNGLRYYQLNTPKYRIDMKNMRLKP